MTETHHRPKGSAMISKEATRFIITPHYSVNEFVYGLTPAKIKKQCGIAFKIEIDNIMQTITEQREACEQVYEENKLAYIVINKHAEPIIGDISSYSNDTITKLMDMDQNHLIGSRYINFRTLGVCLGGFGKKSIPEGKLIIAYSKEKTAYFDFFASDN